MQRSLPRNAPGHSSATTDDPTIPIEATLSCLWVLTPVTATVSLLVVSIAMLTNQWLHTEEKMNNASYNGTGERDYLSKLTISGLWMFCFTNPGETLYECSKIDYFSKDEYSPDPNDSTLAIPYTVTRTVLFFMAASVLLSLAYICCLLGQCRKQRALYTFISGVIFIVTGLVMLFGLIMYISIFKAEIGSKLRPRSQLQPPAFEYSYGYSFLLYVTGLISTQLSGISSIFLFIYRLQYEWYKKQQEDVKRGKRANFTVANQYDHSMFYPCRRHPQAYINSNSAIHFPASPAAAAAATAAAMGVQKRYYFSKEPVQESPCSIHKGSRSHSNSLKDVSSFYDFPPPPTISYQFDEHFSRECNTMRSFPRDVTTNTVSTTADVNCDDYLNESFDDYSPSIQHEHEFVTFDLDQPLPIRAQSVVSINSRNGPAPPPRKTYESDTLRRTTPV